MLERSATTAKRQGSSSYPPSFTPRRLALIARDWRHQNDSEAQFLDEEMGFAPHFASAIRIADHHGADTVLFSLWSHDASLCGNLGHRDLFPPGTKHRHVIVGVSRKPDGETVEIHSRHLRSPIEITQHFGRTTAPKSEKCKFINALPERTFGSTTQAGRLVFSRAGRLFYVENPILSGPNEADPVYWMNTRLYRG